jgi:superfamily II DNA helicase RecQ
LLVRLKDAPQDVRNYLQSRNLSFNSSDWLQRFKTAVLIREIALQAPSEQSPVAYKRDTHVVDLLNPTQRKRTTVFAKLLCADFFLINESDTPATVQEVASITLAEAFARWILLDDDFAKDFGEAMLRLRSKTTTLLTISLKGQPRVPDIVNNFQTGITNSYGIDGKHCHLDVIDLSNSGRPTRLLVWFPTFKHGPERELIPSLCPEEVGRALALTESLGHTAEVCALGKIADASMDGPEGGASINLVPHIAAKRFIFAPDLTEKTAPTATAVRKKEFYADVEDTLNRALHLRPSTLKLASHRMLWASLTSVHCSDRLPAQTEREVAAVFGHTTRTHDLYYLQTFVAPGGGKYSIQRAHTEFFLDTALHLRLGISGIEFSPQNILASLSLATRLSSPLPAWRLVYRMLPEDALDGLVELGRTEVGAVMREAQKRMSSYFLNPVRDSLHVVACGGGKSIALWMRAVYSFACELARSDNKQLLLASRLESSPLFDRDESSQRAAELLASEKVASLLQYCLRDTSFPPSNLVTLVLVPTKVLRTQHVRDLKGRGIIRSKYWTKETHSEISAKLTDIIRGGPNGTADVDAIVTTLQRLKNSEVISLVNDAFKNQIFGELVVDEAHDILESAGWKDDVRVLNRVFRYGAPTHALTGSLQKVLEPELALLCQYGVGRTSIAAEIASRSVIWPQQDHHSAEQETQVQEWKQKLGINRDEHTIPKNVAHGVLSIKKASLSSPFFDEFGRILQEWHNDGRATCTHVICPTRDSVQVAKESIQAAFQGIGRVISLVGGEETNEYVEAWCEGNEDIVVAVTTTVATLGLNNPRCDAVFSIGTYFGPQLYVQGANRGGRAGQDSRSIFVHIQDWWAQVAQRELSSSQLYFYQANGIDIGNPRIREALEPEAMKSFLVTNSCRLRALELLMDGSDSQEDCGKCDVCNTALQEWINEEKVRLESVDTNQASQQQLQDQNNQELQAMLINEQVAQQVQAAEAQAGEQALQNAFADIRNFLLGGNNEQLQQQCFWHGLDCPPHLPVHEFDRVFFEDSGMCVRHFMRYFLQVPDHWLSNRPPIMICFRCGDKYQPSCPTCNKELHQEEGLCRCFIFGRCTEICTRDKARGLVIWALRSRDGYDRLNRHYAVHGALGGQPLPQRVLFVHEYGGVNPYAQSNTKTGWKKACVWLKERKTNAQFWMAVKAAVREKRIELGWQNANY